MTKSNWTNDIRFMIMPDDFNELYTLYSIVPTNFGGDAVNFICEGTQEYCEAVKHKLIVEYQQCRN